MAAITEPCVEPTGNWPQFFARTIRRKFTSARRGAEYSTSCGDSLVMANIINLRTARKQAERRKDEKQAETNRLAHGVPRSERERGQAQRNRSQRQLDGHRRDDADGDGSPA